jgi:exo-beta-1,3-glucanase (GH17 family)
MTFKQTHLARGSAICYSGYRHGQSPGEKIYPSKEQIREDLQILRLHWRLLRLYDCSPHAERVLEVIRSDGLDFQVMLGAYLGPEVNNPGCPWGATFSDDALQASRLENAVEVERLIKLARRFRDIVFAVAVGNEATVGWTDHLVPLDKLIAHVRRVKRSVTQPVTFCENYVPWQAQLQDLVPELDFVSLHTYPLWEYKAPHEALAYTQDNVMRVMERYPDKAIVISEAGWATASNGRGMHAHHATPEQQTQYLRELLDWTQRMGQLCFVFEAFDEPWKGSDDPLEPEKHWGLFTVDRQPKHAMQELFAMQLAGARVP